MSDEEIKTLFNVVDKLEKRIFLLEKVLSSHAKCIGQLREEKFIPIRKDQIDEIEKELER
jgi:hypothetical protein